MTTPNEFPPQQELPFLAHLIELRDRLLRVVAVVVVIFLGLFAFANDLYTLLAEPLLRHMPTGTSMIATEVASPFLTPFKLTLVLSVFISIPFILYQAWGFIAPALYQKEKKLVYPLLISSTLLFYLGMVFAYFVVFPLVFGFLTGVVPEGVAVMTDISRYLDFVLKMFFAFGIAFEVPIATILLIWTGMTTAEKLAEKRPYIIVGAFVFGMLLTPPDIISQTLLAVPMWILFELGLIFSKMYTKPDKQEDEESENDDSYLNPATVAAANASATNKSSSFVSDEELAVNYSEEEDPYTHLTLEEMEAELDRLEEEDDDADDEEEDSPEDEDGMGHEEFEPSPDQGDALIDEEDGSPEVEDGMAHEEFEPLPDHDEDVIGEEVLDEGDETKGKKADKPGSSDAKPEKNEDNPF